MRSLALGFLALLRFSLLQVSPAEAGKKAGRPRSTGAGFGRRPFFELRQIQNRARDSAERRHNQQRQWAQQNRAQLGDQQPDLDLLHFEEQSALQREQLEELTTAVHGESRDVSQEASQRAFPHAVPLEMQREAARNVRAAVTHQMHQSFPIASEEDMQSARIAFALPMPPGPSTLFLDDSDDVV